MEETKRPVFGAEAERIGTRLDEATDEFLKDPGGGRLMWTWFLKSCWIRLGLLFNGKPFIVYWGGRLGGGLGWVEVGFWVVKPCKVFFLLFGGRGWVEVFGLESVFRVVFCLFLGVGGV